MCLSSQYIFFMFLVRCLDFLVCTTKVASCIQFDGEDIKRFFSQDFLPIACACDGLQLHDVALLAPTRTELESLKSLQAKIWIKVPNLANNDITMA